MWPHSRLHQQHPPPHSTDCCCTATGSSTSKIRTTDSARSYHPTANTSISAGTHGPALISSSVHLLRPPGHFGPISSHRLAGHRNSRRSRTHSRTNSLGILWRQRTVDGEHSQHQQHDIRDLLVDYRQRGAVWSSLCRQGLTASHSLMDLS
jgi:hypothetical protein